jgi:hypothetical protein
MPQRLLRVNYDPNLRLALVDRLADDTNTRVTRCRCDPNQPSATVVVKFFRAHQPAATLSLA